MSNSIFKEKSLNHKIEYLKLSDISNDKKFNLNSNSGFKTLKKSIASIGIIYPLLAWKSTNIILLIDGFKRLQIAKNSGKTELPFILLPFDYTLLDVIKIRYYNLKQHDLDLNVLQKTAIYSLIEETRASDDLLCKWQKTLNLSNPEKLSQVLNWPKVAKDYIYKYNVSLKQIRFLLDQTNETINKIFSFAESLSIRIVELNRIYEMVSEIALNDKTSIISIFKSNQIKSIINDDDRNRNQKIFKLKKTLYEWRFPIISQYQKHLNEKLKVLSFDDNIQINYDKTLEKPEIFFSARLRNSQDLNNLVTSISSTSNLNALKNILELL